jgi:hypothetical protein
MFLLIIIKVLINCIKIKLAVSAFSSFRGRSCVIILKKPIYKTLELCPLPLKELGPGFMKISLVRVKVKVKFSLEQAMKAQRGSTGIALLFL